MVDNDAKMKLPHISGLPRIRFKYANIRSSCFLEWMQHTVASHCKGHDSLPNLPDVATTKQRVFGSDKNDGSDSYGGPSSSSNKNEQPVPFCLPCDGNPHSHKALTRTSQTDKKTPRTAILIGIHLCGTLSSVAVQIFQKVPLLSSLILSPCCMPRRRRKKDGGYKLLTLAKSLHQTPHQMWCWTLLYLLKSKLPGARTDMLHDSNLDTTKKTVPDKAKNVFIWALRGKV
eukprot:CAMPEP_0184496396 /NCGR_PEP_ID=MMETSP0113_2-20130426/33853_1 /TAXON_ID=91329 /ORGANISM="Norrisiella sphaerica, Strain BC52" /LENGTH=229 /DNA_ID=CAMNT_0026883003 /DNA_START=314 /DNA_END=1003 /DNA_ORIENTATION=+